METSRDSSRALKASLSLRKQMESEQEVKLCQRGNSSGRGAPSCIHPVLFIECLPWLYLVLCSVWAKEK